MALVDEVIVQRGGPRRPGLIGRWLLTAAVLVLIVAGLWFALALANRLDPAYQAREAEQAYRAAQVAEAIQPAAVASAALWALLPPLLLLAGAGVGLAIAWRRWGDRVSIDGRYQVEALRAQHQPGQGPQSLTYSPHTTSTYRPLVAPASPAALPPALDQVAAPEPAALPGAVDLSALLASFRPTPQHILLGLDAGGAQITVPAAALCHVALAGATGGGKSNLLRLLMPQLQAIGAQVVLADPHFAPLDVESGDDWRPIMHRLHMAPAVKPAAIGDMLTWFTDELERRLELRRAGEPVGPPLFFAYDELPAIVASVKDAPDLLGKVLREGRKVRCYTVGASQDFLIKTIGGSGGIRDCYRTAFYVGGDTVSASKLLDMPQRDIDDGQLGGGVALLRSAATAPARLVRVPLADNAAITRLLSDNAATIEMPSEPPARSGPGSGFVVAEHEPLPGHHKALDARALRVLTMLRDKRPHGDILADVWGVTAKGGSTYSRALAELRDVIAQLVEG